MAKIVTASESTTTSDIRAARIEPDFFTVADIAKLLRCSPKTIRRRIDKGLLLARPEGGRYLIDSRDYHDYLRRLPHRVKAVDPD